MAGRTSSQVITRYAGVQVQTSALGVNIPVGWGTFRCKCNLVDYLDFKATAQHASGKGGGKGGGQVTTGYSYSATIIAAICEGPIDKVTTVYVNSTVHADRPNKTALAQVGLGLSVGAVGQAPWSYLTSNHPAHAIGYSGLAIVHAPNYPLGSQAMPPNHSFEVVRLTGFGVTGSEDADPSLVVADFFQNSRTGVPGWPSSGLLGGLARYQDYCLAAGLLVSPVIDQQRSASDFVTELLKATNSTCVWSEGMLKFVPYGDTPLRGNGKTYTPNNTPVYSLSDDDFVQDHPGDPVLQVDIEDQSDAYNVVQLEYLDRTNQYNMAIALASDAANVAQYGLRRKDPDTVHCVCDPKVAAISAQLYLQRTLYIRAQYKFKLGWMFALIEPGDILELTDPGLGLSAYTVRVVQIDQDEKYGLSFTCEDYPVGVSHAPLYEMQTSAGYAVDQAIDPGGVEANLLQWSDSPTTAPWLASNVTVAPHSANDQYGLPLASAIVPTSGVSGSHTLSQEVGAAYVFPNVNYTFAVCLQAGAHAFAVLRCGDTIGNGWNIFVDLSAGVVTQTTNDGSNPTNMTLVSASVNPTLVSGVWRVVMTVQIASVSGGINCIIEACDPSGANVWTGDGSNALYVSQPQLRQGVDAGVYAATQGAPAGPVLFNPPSVLAGQGEIWAAAAGGPNWGGAYVWVSVDGSSYQQVGTIESAARYGQTTTAFPSAADPDTADSLGVDLGASGGGLTGTSQVSADNGATLCLIDDELITYEAATLTNPSRYTLGSYIRRGYLNTPVAAHGARARFVRLDDSVFQFPYLSTNVGQTVYVKFQSFNLFGKAVVDLSDCIAYACTPNPASSRPPAPSAWAASGGTLPGGAGVLVPAIQITGAVDDPSATGVAFFYRVHGASAWTGAGIHPVTTTAFDVTSVLASTPYDVAVAYVVGGVETALTTIGPVTTGNPGYGSLATLSSVGSTTGTIDTAGVGTTQIAPLSITDGASAFSSGALSIGSPLTAQSVTAQSVTYTAFGEVVTVSGGFKLTVQSIVSNITTSQPNWGYVWVARDGTNIFTCDLGPGVFGVTGGSPSFFQYFSQMLSFVTLDNPPAGPHIYTSGVSLYAPTSAALSSLVSPGDLNNRTLIVREDKR